MRKDFGRSVGSEGGGLPAVVQPRRRFQDIGWVPSALGILGLSGLLAVAPVWLWRSGPGRSSSVEAATPAAGSTTLASASTERPEPIAADAPQAAPAPALVDTQSGATAASRPIVPFPAELRDPAVVEAAAAPSAVPKQPSRITIASAEAVLPSGSVSVSAPEQTPPAPGPSPAAVKGTAPVKGAAISIEEAQRLAARATNLLKAGDIAGARLLLARASSSGEARGTFLLAETYDPKVLARWNVRGIKADPEKAKALYRQAADAGLVEARGRIEALR